MVQVPSLKIIGLGAATPIGRNVWASAAAARAGLCGFVEHPFMIDTAGEPMRVARAPWLEAGLEGVNRFSELLLPAIGEALAPIHGYLEQRAIKLGLVLGLPPRRPGQSEALADELSDVIVRQYQGLFTQLSRFEVGHAAGHLCLDAALKECKMEGVDGYIVAGVDSYLAPETLEWVEECDQLHGAGLLNNAWGFIPGEAAGALLIANGELAIRSRVEILGKLISVGLGQESKLIKSNAVCIGEGLTQAFRKALDALAPEEQIDNVFYDLNGESYRSDEYGFTALRFKDRFRSASDFVAPADCWGDIGAAGVFLHVGLAVICHKKRYGKGPLSMVCASSECGVRGAVIVYALD